MLDIYEAGISSSPPVATRAAISASAQNMARLKNVPLADDELPKFVDLLIAEKGVAHILFASIDPALVDARSQIINHQLDILATARLLELVAVIEGKPSIHDPIVQTVAGEIMSQFEKTVDMDNIKWPAPFEMVERYYSGKLRGPTIATKEDGTIVTCWWKGFELHRDPVDGPARIETRASYRREEYWVDGKRHRPWADGPAIVITDVVEGMQRREEAWWFEGERHRPHEEGPALITTHYGDNANLAGEEYFEHGKCHRPSNLGPAVTHWDRAGRKTLEQFMEEGELHRDPKEGPAEFYIRAPSTFKGAEDDVTVTRYCVRGETHRDEGDGPALMVQDNVTGILLREDYDRNGKGFRKDGPAITERSREGRILFQAWCNQMGFSRDPSIGPATNNLDPETGITTELYIVDGEPVSPPLPALVRRDVGGKIIEQSVWDGENYRPVAHAENAETASDG